MTYFSKKFSGYKNPVRCASTENVDLNTPGAEIDGQALQNGDRVLLKNQTAAPTNGIYRWEGAATALTRTHDANEGRKLKSGSIIPVLEGTEHGESLWMLDTESPVDLGTDDLTFTKVGESLEGAVFEPETAPRTRLVGDKVTSIPKLIDSSKYPMPLPPVRGRSHPPTGPRWFREHVWSPDSRFLAAGFGGNSSDPTVRIYEVSEAPNTPEKFFFDRTTRATSDPLDPKNAEGNIWLHPDTEQDFLGSDLVMFASSWDTRLPLLNTDQYWGNGAEEDFFSYFTSGVEDKDLDVSLAPHGTIGCWAAVVGGAGDYRPLLTCVHTEDVEGQSQITSGVEVYLDTDNFLKATLWNEGVRTDITTLVEPSLGAENAFFVTLTWDDSGHVLYVDGAEVATGLGTLSPVIFDVDDEGWFGVGIGADSGDFVWRWPGYFQELFLLSSALLADEVEELFALFTNYEMALLEVSSDDLFSSVRSLQWSSDGRYLLVGYNEGYSLYAVNHGNLEHLVTNEHITAGSSWETSVGWADYNTFGVLYSGSPSNERKLFIGEVQGSTVIERFNDFTDSIFYGWFNGTTRLFGADSGSAGDPAVWSATFSVKEYDLEENTVTLVDDISPITNEEYIDPAHQVDILPDGTVSWQSWYIEGGTLDIAGQVQLTEDQLLNVSHKYRVEDSPTYISDMHPSRQVVAGTYRRAASDDVTYSGVIHDIPLLLQRTPSGTFVPLWVFPRNDWSYHSDAFNCRPKISPDGKYAAVPLLWTEFLCVYKISEDVDDGMPTF